MEHLFSAVLLYVIVFGADYLFYVKRKSAYSYVSRRTYALFIGGQVAAVGIFYPLYKPFLMHLWTEVTLLAILLCVLFIFTYALVRDRLYVCSNGSRTLRCLTPYYVCVKGAEIVFQQLIYVAIALSLADVFGVHFYTYLMYMVVLLLTHIVVILGGGQAVVKSLTLGLALISVPIFYVFTQMELFWPAVYLHSIMYVFYWLALADFDVEPGDNAQHVENSG